MNNIRRPAAPLLSQIAIALASISLILAWIPGYNLLLTFTIGILFLFGIFSWLTKGKAYQVQLKAPLVLAVIAILIAVATNVSWNNAKEVALSQSSYQAAAHQKMKVGQTVQVEEISYQVNSVKFVDQLPDQVALPGQQFIVINVSLANLADTDYGTGKLDYPYKTTDFHIAANGQEVQLIQNSNLTMPLEDGVLHTKGQTTGNLYAQVPKNSQVELLLSRNSNFKINSGQPAIFTYILNEK